MKSDGNVLGIDVGWSTGRKTSAVCLLRWDSRFIDWEIRRFRATDSEREDVILRAVGGRALVAVAIDGPLRRGFDEIGHYRNAERILTHRAVRERIGKPGQSSSPNGRELNRQANRAAKLVDERCSVETTSSPVRIAPRAIMEAFPNAFLGLMTDCPEALLPKRKSDRYFKHLARRGHFKRFLADLLPGRELKSSPNSITNHEDRAAFACALTALSVAAEDFTAVGDDDGWIILPPRRHFAAWAWDALSVAERAGNKRGRLYCSTAS